MEDNKTEDNNKYKVLSSFLDNNPVFPDGNAFPSDEESQKLIFLWDKCNPPAEDVDSVWDKTQQKIKDEVSVAKKRPVFMSAWIWVAASVALLMGLAYFFYHYQGGITEDEKTKMEQLMLAETSAQITNQAAAGWLVPAPDQTTALPSRQTAEYPDRTMLLPYFHRHCRVNAGQWAKT